MPLTQRLLFYVPTIPLGLIIIFASVAISISGLVIVRKFVPHQKMKLHNDVASAIFQTLGMVYAVLLAFIVVISWQDFDKSTLHVQQEANTLVDLHRDAAALPQSFRGAVYPLMKDYADAVVNEEWNMLARGEESPNARAILRKIWVVYSGYEPKTEGEKIFFAESVSRLNELRELRRFRIIDSKTGIEPILWFILIVGGMVTIAFTFFFGSENFAAHVLMASTLAVMISLILFTILLLDFPFTGSVKISSDMFRQMINF